VAELAELVRCEDGEKERLWGKVVNIAYVARFSRSNMMQDVRAGGWLD